MPAPATTIDRLRAELTAALTAAGCEAALPLTGGLTVLTRAATDAGVAPVDVGIAVARALNVPWTDDLAGYVPSPEFLAAIPIAFARQHGVLGLLPDSSGAAAGPEAKGRVLVALADTGNWGQLQIIARFLQRPVAPVIAPPDVVLAAIDEAYQQRTGQAQAFLDEMGRESQAAPAANPAATVSSGREEVSRVIDELRSLAGREDLLDNASRAPVIKLVNLILFEAVRSNASDVHVQPYEDRLIVRTRIDGVLYDSYSLPKAIQEEVISRIKVMGKMNIAEKRLSQDGRATVQVGQRNIDLRIASLPTSFGERVVVRLLDKSARLFDLSELGMDPRTLATYARLITVEHGLILVTGPTGSGKSTTLYSALKRINSRERNILTLEDPIEYQLEGISQTQVSDKKGMTFASGLRSVLRQDPDVIMVGEIRDIDTATMAIQSSLTGHLVFSTLHTNDAASAVTRLLDLGIEPYLVASSVMGVLAQRLVRRICPDCAAPYRPSAAEMRWLGVDRTATQRMRMGTGCAACRNTGYRGRLGTFELLVINDDIRRLIQSRAIAGEVKDAALRCGTRTLRDDGIDKILAGSTTIPEVERVTLEPELEDAPAGPAPDVLPLRMESGGA
jgi:general secretion pathway protein E